MRDLSEECGDLTLAGGQVTSVSELRERMGGLNEGRIVVETLGGASDIVFVQEKRVVEVLRNYG
jgi:hypothetical protein